MEFRDNTDEIMAGKLNDYLDEETRIGLLELMEGDNEMMIDLIDTSLETSPDLLENLSQATETGDGTAIKEAAHSLKSSNAQMGALRFATLCQEMENYGKSNEIEKARTHLPVLVNEYKLVSAALRAWRESLQ